MTGRPAYAGSMDRDPRDGSYSYRGFDVVKTELGWEVRDGIGRCGLLSDRVLGTVQAVKPTRNAAGVFIDRRVYNELKSASRPPIGLS